MVSSLTDCWKRKEKAKNFDGHDEKKDWSYNFKFSKSIFEKK